MMLCAGFQIAVQECAILSRAGGGHIQAFSKGEDWIKATFEPYRVKLFDDSVEFMLSNNNFAEAPYCILAGFVAAGEKHLGDKGRGAESPRNTTKKRKKKKKKKKKKKNASVSDSDDDSDSALTLMFQNAAAGRGGEELLSEAEKVHPPTLCEVLVIRDPPTVHVYEIVEHGRRFYRTLVFTSDVVNCLHDFSGERPSID